MSAQTKLDARCRRAVAIYAGCPCARPPDHDGSCSPFGTAEPLHADGYPFAGDEPTDRLFAAMFVTEAMGR